METESFLAPASELLTIQSTADRPVELNRALDFAVDFVGPGFTVERFESGSKPSALLYVAAERPRRFQVILNPPSSARAARATACTPAAPRT
jgi:succinyl-diaminopimelate desuccinylase